MKGGATMIGNVIQNIRTVMLIQPQAIADNAEWVGSKGSTPVSIDTVYKGSKAHSARIVFAVGATDVAIAKLNIYESDDDTTYTEVDGVDFVNDTSVAPGATDDNKLYGWFLDLRQRKRYLRIEAQAGNGTTGTYAIAWCDLYHIGQGLRTAADRGFAAHFIDTSLVSS